MLQIKQDNIHVMMVRCSR